MTIEDYLSRIGLKERPAPNLEGLGALHRAHLLAIPYENLDVQLGRPVTIERPAIFDKIVRRQRGGWCYEMNGLLGWALDELGFRVTRATGAVMRELAGDAMAGNHLVLKVELDEGVYLADVGFGDGSLEPIQVTAGPFSDGRFEFALSRADGEWWRFHNHPAGGAKSFDFRLAPADESLFAEKCAFLQTSETSPFVQNLVCQRHTKERLSILRGRVLKTVTPQGASERLLESERDLVAVLGDTFALHVPEAATLWPKICSRH